MGRSRLVVLCAPWRMRTQIPISSPCKRLFAWYIQYDAGWRAIRGETPTSPHRDPKRPLGVVLVACHIVRHGRGFVNKCPEAGGGRNGCLNTHPALQVGLTENSAELNLTAPVAQLDGAPASGAGCVGSSPAGGTTFRSIALPKVIRGSLRRRQALQVALLT
jgi:hypothetical protein